MPFPRSFASPSLRAREVGLRETRRSRVGPLADNLVEGRETVRLTVVPQFDDGPQRYTVGCRNRAIVLIADHSC